MIYTDPGRYERQRVPEDPYTQTLDAIVDKYGVTTALDLGCGLGVDVAIMEGAGLNVRGLDGSEQIRPHLLFDADRYMVADLSRDLSLHPVDLVWCREVAEHLPFGSAQVLIRNIVRNCRVCYFTAAPPGQIGDGHINGQYPAFWKALFRKHGFHVDQILTALNRQHPNEDDRRNGMVVRK